MTITAHSVRLDPKDDFTSEQGARRLGGRILGYWLNQGQYPDVWVERADIAASPTDSNPLWVVKSNMVGGRPQ